MSVLSRDQHGQHKPAMRLALFSLVSDTTSCRHACQAILGSCQRSKASLLSGDKHWRQFMRDLGGGRPPYPVELDMLLAWSLTFRCSRTFQNYLNYVRSAGLLHGFSDDVFNSFALRKAEVAIDMRQLWKPRQKMWIGQAQLQHVMTQAGDPPLFGCCPLMFSSSAYFPSACPWWLALGMIPPLGKSSHHNQSSTLEVMRLYCA